MRPYIRERAIKIGEHIIKTGDTLRETGAKFYIDRSTVRTSILKLKEIDPSMYEKVRAIMEQHKLEAPLKGAIAMRKKIGDYIQAPKVNCMLTNCKWNTAKKSQEKGYCFKDEICIGHKEEKLYSGDYSDFGDCETYEYEYKGEEFYKVGD